MNTSIHQGLKNFLRQYHGFSDDELENITKHFKSHELKKGEFLLEKGQICTNIYFVSKGCVRLYYLNEGVETCVWFSFENNSAIELYSYLSQTPSDYYLECIEGGTVWEISKADINKLCIEHNSLHTFFRNFWEDVIVNLLKRLASLQRDSAEQRYLDLLNDPSYLQRIPQKYLASYIGITPTSLSRIRRNITSKLS